MGFRFYTKLLSLLDPLPTGAQGSKKLCIWPYRKFVCYHPTYVNVCECAAALRKPGGVCLRYGPEFVMGDNVWDCVDWRLLLPVLKVLLR